MGKGDILYRIEHVEAGLPPPEKWGGLELAKTVGMNGYTTDTYDMNPTAWPNRFQRSNLFSTKP